MEEELSLKCLWNLGDILTSFSALYVVSSLAVVYSIYLFFRPLNMIKDLSDIGYNHLFNEQRTKQTRKSRAEVASESRRKRVVGNTPPDFPNGWFAISDSSEVATERVKHVSALGEDFAVFRDSDGQVHILSAICPHLGANMAIGGRIEGNCIRCPFHGWKFSGETGKCQEIPYTKNVPDEAQVKRWLSHEVNTFIFVWYHADNIKPTWYPEPIPVIEEGKWWYRGRHEYLVNCHIQEIPENGADVTHLAALHGPFVFAGSDLFALHKWLPGIAKHNWKASWKPNTEPGRGHIGSMSLQTSTIFFNNYDTFPMDVKIDQVGPAYVVMDLNTPFGSMFILQTVTPIERMEQKVVHKMFYPLSMSIYGTVAFFTEKTMFERDVVVWNHKKYEDKPLLTKEESTIGRHRRWYNQFYSENSRRSNKREYFEW